MTVQHYAPPDLLPADNGIARWVGILQPAAELADRIAATEFVPGAMRGKPDVVCACILYGDELGLGPMQALSSIHVVDGRPSPSSELMRALIFRAGHQLLVRESSGSRCTVSGVRSGQREGVTITWTIDMARQAGLAGKGVWNRYPRAMLLARASSELARVLFPDVVRGLSHIADDESIAQDFDAWAQSMGPEPEEPEAPATKTVRRRKGNVEKAIAASPARGRKPAAKKAAETTEEPPPPEPDLDDYRPPLPPAIEDVPLPAMPQPEIPASPELPPVDDAAPDPGTKPVQDRTRRALFAAFRDLGIEDDREERLRICTTAVGREINSTRDLTQREALRVAHVLNDLAVGLLTIIHSPSGEVVLMPTREDYDG
jgi:hypothetical protein